MIARLRGEVVEAGNGRLVVDVHGVGYEVQVPETLVITLGEIGASVELFVRQIVREDDISLYGFLNADQRRLFDLLREVKGCGSRTSLSVISTLGEEATMAAIAGQDSKLLARAPGVGPRLAERIIVELKDKASELAMLSRSTAAVAPISRTSRPSDELVDALVALGYRRAEAELAADDARDQAEDVEGQLKVALQRLAR